MTNNTTSALTDEQRKAVECAIELIENDHGDRTVTSRTLRALLTSPRAAAQPPAVSDLPAFPVSLRKMWSGGEVQCWIDDNIKPLVQERHFEAHCAPAAPVAKPAMRPETESENIARDIREGRFPKRSEPKMVPVEQAVAADGARAEQPLSGECFIVIGHGESDIPEAKIVARREELLDAVLGMIYTHASEAPDSVRAEYAESLSDNDEWAADQWSVDFEIGGIVIWRVGLHPVSLRAAVSPATRMLNACDANALRTAIDAAEIAKFIDAERAVELRDIVMRAAVSPATADERAAWIQRTVLEIADECGISGEALARLAHAIDTRDVALLHKLTTPIVQTLRASQAAAPTRIEALRKGLFNARDALQTIYENRVTSNAPIRQWIEDANRVLNGEQAAAPANPQGTFACPICGKETPHEHTSQEIAEHRSRKGA